MDSNRCGALTHELRGERLDCGTSALCKASELVGLEETVGVDRSELDDHAAAPRIVERVRELFVSGLQKPIHLQVALMVTPRGVLEQWLEVVKDVFAETLERQLAELAKDPPV